MRILLLGLACLVSGSLWAQDLTVYDDALQNGFEDWSWATHDLANTNPVAEGSLSISMEPDAWEGLFFHVSSPLAVADYNGLQFWLHGGAAGGQAFRVFLQLDQAVLGELDLAPIAAGVWEHRTIDLADIGIVSGSFDGIIFQDQSGGDQGTLFIDHVELLENDDPPPPPTPITITVDPEADRRAVNPLIYGANFGDASQLSDPGFPLRRWGGNSVTRYNWMFDISNKAFDWFFLQHSGGGGRSRVASPRLFLRCFYR